MKQVMKSLVSRQSWNHWFHGPVLRLSNFRKFDGKSLIRAWSGVTDIAQINICDPWYRVLLSNFLNLDNRSRNPWNQWWNESAIQNWFPMGIYFDYPTLDNLIVNPWSGLDQGSQILLRSISGIPDQGFAIKFSKVG